MNDLFQNILNTLNEADFLVQKDQANSQLPVVYMDDIVAEVKEIINNHVDQTGKAEFEKVKVLEKMQSKRLVRSRTENQDLDHEVVSAEPRRTLYCVLDPPKEELLEVRNDEVEAISEVGYHPEQQMKGEVDAISEVGYHQEQQIDISIEEPIENCDAVLGEVYEERQHYSAVQVKRELVDAVDHAHEVADLPLVPETDDALLESDAGSCFEDNPEQSDIEDTQGSEGEDDEPSLADKVAFPTPQTILTRPSSAAPNLNKRKSKFSDEEIRLHQLNRLSHSELIDMMISDKDSFKSPAYTCVLAKYERHLTDITIENNRPVVFSVHKDGNVRSCRRATLDRKQQLCFYKGQDQCDYISCVIGTLLCSYEVSTCALNITKLDFGGRYQSGTLPFEKCFVPSTGRIDIASMLIANPEMASVLQFVCPNKLYVDMLSASLFDKEGKLINNDIPVIVVEGSLRDDVDNLMECCRAGNIVLGDQCLWSDESFLKVLTMWAESDGAVYQRTDCPFFHKMIAAMTNQRTIAEWKMLFDEWCSTNAAAKSRHHIKLHKYADNIVIFHSCMFYSFEHLVSRDSKFALIWKVATYNTKSLKQMTRSSVLSVSIPEICDSLMKRLPTGRGLQSEVASKFSLYLVAQLMYGAVRVLERQVTYLELDTRAAYESCKRIPMNFDLGDMSTEHLGMPPPKKRRMSKDNIGNKKGGNAIDPLQNLHIISVDELDLLPGIKAAVATHEQITLRDEVFNIAPTNNYFMMEDDLQPCTDAQMQAAFGDWNDIRSCASSNTSDRNPANISKIGLIENASLNKDINRLRGIPVAPPGAEFDHLNQPNFDDLMDFSVQPQGDQMQQTFEIGMDLIPHVALTAPGEEPMDLNIMRTPLKAVNDATELNDSQRQSAGNERQAYGRLENSRLELEELDSELQGETPRTKRKRMSMAAVDREKTQISYAEMKEMMADYSSLCRPARERRVNLDVVGKLSAEQLMTPAWPAWRGRAFSKDLRCLYRSHHQEPLSFENAVQMNPLDPVYRGKDDELWRYEKSQKDEEEEEEWDESIHGPRHSDVHGSHFGSDRERTPGIAFTREDTPDRYKYAVPPEFNSDLLPPLDLEAPFPQFPVEETDGRTSRQSHSEVEKGRKRNTMMSNATDIDGRPSSVMLFNNPDDDIFGKSNNELSLPGKTGTIPNKKHEEVKKILIRSVVDAEGDMISFGRLFTPSKFNRAQAARAFAGLLELVKDGQVQVEQHSWCGEIWVGQGDKMEPLDEEESGQGSTSTHDNEANKTLET